MAELGLLYRLETLVGLFSVTSALYAIIGISPQSSGAVLFLAPVLVSLSTTSYSSLWGSLFILSTVANTVFLLLFLASTLVSKGMNQFRFQSAFSVGSVTFALFTLLLLSIKASVSERISDAFGLLDQILVLAVVSTVFTLFLHWKTPFPRKVGIGDIQVQSAWHVCSPLSPFIYRESIWPGFWCYCLFCHLD